MYPRLLEISCYHSQQAVEKALKAFLLFHGQDAPRTHDLDRLCQACESLTPSFNAFRGVCSELTAYAAATRYPSDMEITEEDASFAIREAGKIFTFTDTHIRKIAEIAPAQEPEAEPTM